MSTVAQQLRQAREARNLSLAEVADFLKVRTDHLRALEEGDFGVFAAPVYIRGFVRTYARMLRLDVPQTIAALAAELALTEKFSEPPPLTPHTRGPLDFVTLQLSKLNWRIAAITIGVMLLLALLVPALLANRRPQRAADPLAGLKPGLYQPVRSGGDTLPVPPPAARR